MSHRGKRVWWSSNFFRLIITRNVGIFHCKTVKATTTLHEQMARALGRDGSRITMFHTKRVWLTIEHTK